MNKNNRKTAEYLVGRMERYKKFLMDDLLSASKKQLKMLKEIQLLLNKFKKINE